MTKYEAEMEARRLRREEHEREQREFEVKRALRTLEKHGHQAGGEDFERVRAEHAEYQAALVELEEQRAALEQRLDGDHQAAELARLQQGLRDRDWRDTWRDVAREAGMHPKAVDAAWRNHGLKPEADQPDRKALERLCDDLRRDHDYLWPRQPTAAPETTPAASQAAPAAPEQQRAAPPPGGTRHVFNGQWSAVSGAA